MFTKSSEEGYIDSAPGIRQKTLVYGDKTLMTEFLLSKGHILPAHSHPHEQTGYLVKGSLILHIGNEKFKAIPGDSWCISGGVTHSADILEDFVAIEVFSPLRENYLPK